MPGGKTFIPFAPKFSCGKLPEKFGTKENQLTRLPPLGYLLKLSGVPLSLREGEFHQSKKLPKPVTEQDGIAASPAFP